MYFPSVKDGSSLHDLIANLKKVMKGKASLLRVIQMKNGNVHSCDIVLQQRQTNIDPEKCPLPTRSTPEREISQCPVLQPLQSQAAIAEPPCSLRAIPYLQDLPTNPQHSSLLDRIQAYEQACFLEYNNIGDDREGSPIYWRPPRRGSVPLTGRLRRTTPLHSLHNCTLEDTSLAVAVCHMVNLAMIKNGSYTMYHNFCIYSTLKICLKRNISKFCV